jgi:hypothetical protein
LRICRRLRGLEVKEVKCYDQGSTVAEQAALMYGTARDGTTSHRLRLSHHMSRDHARCSVCSVVLSPRPQSNTKQTEQLTSISEGENWIYSTQVSHIVRQTFSTSVINLSIYLTYRWDSFPDIILTVTLCYESLCMRLLSPENIVLTHF